MRNDDKTLWTAGFFNERFPAPVSPLGWTLLGPLIEEIALRDPLRYLGYPDAETLPLTRLWRGHPYANALAFHIFYKVFPDFLLPEDAYRYFPDGNTSLGKRAPYPCWIDAPRVVFSLLRAFLSDPFNVSPLNNYRHWARYTREHDRRVAALCARLDALACAEPREIFAALREAERAHRDLLRIHRWSLMHADLTFGTLKRLVRAWVDRERASEIVARLIVDVPNKTSEVDAALRDLASRVRESPQDRDALEYATTFEEFTHHASCITLETFHTFLSLHGHRSFSLDITVPTFADDPSQVIRLLQATPLDHRPRTANEHGSQRSAACPEQGRRVGGLPFWQRWVLNRVVSLARHYIRMREDQRYYWQKSLAVSRHLYLLLADRLVTDGVIMDHNAVFYTTHRELVEYFDGRLAKDALTQSIAARQAEWREYQCAFEQSPTASYPPFLRGDVPLERVGAGLVPAHFAQWRGRAVSPGTARGVARVARTANDLTCVQRGEILIAPSTDPAWTPVFARLAGLVLERGGVLSHGAVVAREYRVPAVAGIANIMEEIRDGEMVEVDGNAGVVARVMR